MGQRLGQHFLTDKKILQKIADVAIATDRVVIEIGPGHGELTEKLLSKNPSRVLTAIERDSILAEQFRRRFPPSRFPHVTLVEGDARVVLPDLLAKANRAAPPAVVGNIPYYLSGFLFRILGDTEIKPSFTVFTVQKEVAERASEHAPHMSLLSASLQIWAEPSLLFEIPPEAFSPAPKVRSAILLLKPKHPLPENALLVSSYRLIRAMFCQPRKKAVSNLFAAFPEKKDAITRFFSEENISEQARPQEFSAERILRLTKVLGI